MSWLDEDHSYSKHWSEQYLKDRSHIIPVKKLFSHGDLAEGQQAAVDKKRSEQWKLECEGSDTEIDVESVDDTPKLIGSSSWYCAETKARIQMNECERHVASTYKQASSDDKELVWEETVNKSNWGFLELKLFNRVAKILQDEKLARLAYKGTANEIVLRRVSVDRSATQLRNALTSVGWPVKLSQWLHLLLIETLPMTLLSCYLDIMQTLRSKVPTLVERMIMPSRDAGNAASERLGILLKRPWDPATTAVVSSMKQQLSLSHSVLFIVVQCTVFQSHVPVTSRRLRFWNSLLSQIGKVVQVGSASDDTEGGADKSQWTVQDLTVHTLNNVHRRVREVALKHSNRKIVLIGWHTASLISCHAALKGDVAAVVCLGFPLYNMFGERGSVDDVLCDVTTPVLFVVGDKAMSCRVNDMEDVRERTFTDALTALVVVNDADDWLRVSDSMKVRYAVTQSMVDRRILESICEFLHAVFVPKDDQATSRFSEVNKKRRHAQLDASGFDDELIFSKRQKDSEDLASEVSPLRKRPNSYSDLSGLEKKRQRPESPLVGQVYRSSSSHQLDQFFSHHKQVKNEGTDRSGMLHGLTFNLQTGSISGLTSVPGSVSGHSSKPLTADKQGLTSKNRKRSREENTQSSRSITIDLTKDPNAQLSSALSKRKSQLLQPTQSQTEAAVAAILGAEKDKTEPEIARESANGKQTAVMSPSSTLGRLGAENDAAISESLIASKSISSNAPRALSISLDGIGTLSGAAPTPVSRSSETDSLLKPVVSSFVRSQSLINDHSKSFIASRSRREDRETQQATAFLERLSGSFAPTDDAGSASSKVFSAGKKLKGFVSDVRRRTLDAASRSSISVQPARSRPRGNKPKGRTLSAAAPGNASGLTVAPTGVAVSSTKNKAPVVRYVLTSSGLTGVLSSGAVSTGRKITVLPESGSSTQQLASFKHSTAAHAVFSPGNKRIPSQGATVRLTPSSKAPVVSVTPSDTDRPQEKKRDVSSTLLTDYVLGAAISQQTKPIATSTTASKGTVNVAAASSSFKNVASVVRTTNVSGVSSARKSLPTVTIARPLSASSTPSESRSAVIYLQDNVGFASALLGKPQPTVKTSQNPQAISRPNLSRAGSNSSTKPPGTRLVTIPRGRAVSTESKKATDGSIKIPSLVLGKFSGDSVGKTATKMEISSKKDS